MSNSLQVSEETKSLITVLKNSLYPGARDESVQMVLEYCKAAKLDPMLKPVHIVPMWNKNTGRNEDVVMPGIGLYRIQAARSEQFAGIDEPIFGPDITELIGSLTITYPEYAKVTVKRLVGGNIASFTAIEFFKENFANKGGKDKDPAPNMMWARRPRGQLAKCAEAQALRKAFPEFGAMPTAEEMEGKETFEIDITPKNFIAANKWIEIAKEALTKDELTECWKKGIIQIKEENDVDGYQRFKKFIAARGEELKEQVNEDVQREPGSDEEDSENE